MADPLSVASGVAGLVSLTIQATQLACKYVAEVNHAGETALQCLRSLSLLRDVLDRIQETETNEEVAAVVKRKTDLLSSDEFDRCAQSLEKVNQRLSALFHDDGKIKKRKALIWPFQSSESASLVQQLQGFRDSFAAIVASDSLAISAKSHQVVVDTQQDVRLVKSDIRAGRMDQSVKEVLDWILPEDAEQWRLGTSKSMPVGTGSWLFESSDYKAWLSSGEGLFWCHGAPGSGKSVLMSQAISHIQYQADYPAIVLSHFCDHRDSRSQTPELIIRHLVRQAALQSKDVLNDLQACPEYLDSKRSRRPLRQTEALRLLFEVCLPRTPFVVVIDGLDECAEDIDGVAARREIVGLLAQASKSTRVLVASRHLEEIAPRLQPSSEALVRATDTDLRTYVTSRLEGLESRVSQSSSLKSAVIDKVVRDADGIFLLARLMVDMLSPASIKNLRQIKKFLAQESWDLSQMYRETLTRIMSGDQYTVELARKVLIWICYAKRPLTEAEIQHALATELEDEDFDPDGITPGDLLRSSCMGVVTCDDHGRYGLFHLTAYEFLRSSPELSATLAQTLISRTCITYLSFASTGQEGSCSTLAALEARRSRFALLDYAAKHWADHAKEQEELLVDNIVRFASHDDLRSSFTQAFYHRDRADEELQRLGFASLPSGTSAIQFLCSRDLALSASRLLEGGANPQEADDQGWTPLISAASYGHLAIVKLLLSHIDRNKPSPTVDHTTDTASEDLSDFSQWVTSPQLVNKPLEEYPWSTEFDSATIEDAAIDQSDRQGWSPLVWAIIKGHRIVAEHLLASGASVDSEDRNHWTPIDWAAFRADGAMIKILLHHTSSTSAHRQRPYDPNRFSPIFLAAAAGDEDSFRALLNHGIEHQDGVDEATGSLYYVLSKSDMAYKQRGPNAMTTSMPSLVLSKKFTVKLYESAIRSGHLTVVKLMIELGATLGTVDGEFKCRSPLHIAASCGEQDICKYLVLKGADVSLKDTAKQTPLDLALAKGAISCINFFLSLSTVASTFLANGAAIPTFLRGFIARQASAKHRKYHMEKSWEPTVSHQCDSMLDVDVLSRFLIKQDSFSDSLASSGRECEDGALVMVRTLLHLGCDANARDSISRRTALTHACKARMTNMVQFLLDNGSDPNSVCNSHDMSPIHVACDDSDVSFEICTILLQGGAHINAINCHGATPLILACRRASGEAIRFLVAQGADINIRDNQGDHALHVACRRGKESSSHQDMERVAYILDLAGSSVMSARCERHRQPSETPLEIAVKLLKWDIVDLLVSKGSPLPSVDAISGMLWDFSADACGYDFGRLIHLGADPTHRHHGTPIITACLQKHHRGQAAKHSFEEDVKALIAAGADINALVEGNWHPAGMSAVQIAKEEGMEQDFIDILVRYGAGESQYKTVDTKLASSVAASEPIDLD